MTAWAKAAITLAIAVVLAYILLSFARDEDVQGEVPSGQAQCSVDPDEDEELRRKMGRAFDSAFQAQIANLYKVYIGNAPTVEQQLAYTRTGIANAIDAWRIANTAVEGWCK